MNYFFRNISYDWYDPFGMPTYIAEVELMPETRRECMDTEKVLYSTKYDDVSKLGLLLNSRPALPSIKNVYFNNPVTVVLWDDGTKTIVKCQDGDTYSKETGLALCMAKKAMGNKGAYNDIFKKWIPEEKKPEPEKSSQKNCVNCVYVNEVDNPICWACDVNYSNWEAQAKLWKDKT